MSGRPDDEARTAQRAATVSLVLFLLAVLAALAVTVSSVSPSVALLAATAVTPIVVLAVIFLFYERRSRAWSFAGSGILGVVGVVLRLVVNGQPQLEVGGGLPVWVTVIYLALGLSLVLSSVWAWVALRRAADHHA